MTEERHLAMEKKEFKVRLATVEDCEELFRLGKEMFTDKRCMFQPDLTVEQLRRDGFGPIPVFRCLVAEALHGGSSLEKALIGLVTFNIIGSPSKGRRIFFEDMYVHADYRQQGVGRALFKAMLEIALDKGVTLGLFMALRSNTMAIQFYEKFGAVNRTTTEDWNCFTLDAEAIRRLADA